jgi:Na+/pantothenate symporter
MLYEYATWSHFDLSTLSSTDLLYPTLALEKLGLVVGLCFVLGITASTYASSDSALTALTTAFCIDFLRVDLLEEKKRKQYKTYVHIGFSVLFFIIILIVKAMNTGVEVINTVLFLAAFTYGPLLGMFAYGLFRKHQVRDALVPVVALLSPVLTYGISKGLPIWFNGFALGPEIVLVNGIITFLGMEMIRRR